MMWLIQQYLLHWQQNTSWLSWDGLVSFDIILSCSIIVEVTVKQCCGSILVVTSTWGSFLALCTWNSTNALEELQIREMLSKQMWNLLTNIPWLLRDELYVAYNGGKPRRHWRRLQPFLHDIQYHRRMYRCSTHCLAWMQESKNGLHG